jgi:hypothetical protein
MRIKLKNVRLSFPKLFAAEAFKDSEPKYSAQFLLDKVKDKEQIAELRKAVLEVAGEKWTKGIPKGVKYCIGDGDEKDYESHQGMIYVTASNHADKRPPVVDEELHPIVAEDNVIYGGCFVNAAIDFWAQDNQYGKRINANLLGVQFVGDGDPFGSKPFNAAEEFEPVKTATKRTYSDAIADAQSNKQEEIGDADLPF